MKKRFLTIALISAISASLLLTSCIGKFQLTNRLMEWNRNIGNKFVNELVFIAFWILPVYEVSGLADILVLNSIEFWSGKSPLAYGKYKIEGSNGDIYLVKYDSKGYTLTNTTDNSTIRLDFNEQKQQWTTNIDGQEIILLTFIDDTHVKLPCPDGSYKIVETNARGLFAYQTEILSGANSENV